MQNSNYSAWPLDRLTSALLMAPAVVVAVAAVSLAACGGGEPAPVAPPSPMLQLSGTAAVGLALPAAKVQARCEQGSGSTQTAADGSYVLKIENGRLPCVLQVHDEKQGLKLHSLALAGDRAPLSNLTPLTEMLLVRLVRAPAEQFFQQFDRSAVPGLSSDRVKAAQTDVVTALAGTLDISMLADFLATPLKAATSSAPQQGDAQDRLLDQLGSRLGKQGQAELLALLASGKSDDPAAPFVPRLSIPLVDARQLTGTSRILLADINYPANVRYIRQPVSWSVVEAGGGRVDPISGQYTAPAQAGLFHVRAQRDDFPAVSATVAIQVADVLTLDQQTHSRVEVAQQVLVREPKAYQALWAEHRGDSSAAPPVDFSQEMVAAVFLGLSGPTGCHGVSVLSLRREASRLVLDYRATTPPDGAVCTQAISSPAHWVRLSRSELPLAFQRQP